MDKNFFLILIFVAFFLAQSVSWGIGMFWDSISLLIVVFFKVNLNYLDYIFNILFTFLFYIIFAYFFDIYQRFVFKKEND